jgi:WD40 repeat protein
MSLLDSLWQMGDLDQIQRILDKTATNPNRGWEWSFYDRLGHLDVGNRVYAGGIPSGDALHTPHGDLYGINTDSSVNIFDVATLKLIHSFPKVSMAPGTFMWSKDGKSFTETSMDGIVAQRDSSTGAVLRTRNLGFPTNFGVSCQARQITVLPDMTGQAWEIGSDMRAHRLDNVPRSSSGQFSDSGKWFVAYGGGLIEVFETNSWKIVKKFKIAGLASAAAIDPQDRWLAVDTEHSVTLFDFSSGKVLSRLAADGGGIAIFSKDDKALAIGSQGRRISVYDCGPVLKLNKIIVGPPWPTFFPSRNRLIGGYRFSKLFDIDSYADIEQRSMGTAPSPTQYTESSGQIYPDGEAACVGAESTGFIELANGEPAKVTPEKRPAVLCSVRPWIKTDRVICRLPSFPTAATVSQDGRYLVLLGSKTATVWNVEEGKEATSYKTEAGGDCISLSHDLSKIAVGYAYGSVDLIDQSTGAVVHARPHTYAVLKVRFSPDDLILATASMDDTAAFLDSSSLAVKRRFVGHSETVYDVDFSPDEKRIATTSDDGTVKVWDPTTGRDLMTFRPGTTSVKAVAWLDQGNTLASMDYQGTLRVLFTKASSPELVRIGARPGL